MTTIFPDFPWRPGMLAISDGRPFVVLHVDDNPDLIHETGEHLLLCRDCERYSSHYGLVNNPMPDPTDPATLGALLGAVREAWDAPCIHTRPALPDGDGQEVWNGRQLVDAFGCELSAPTEFDALMAAWKARPAPVGVSRG